MDTYCLYEETRHEQEELLCAVSDGLEEDLFDEARICTWYHVVDALSLHFLSDIVLQAAQNEVKRAQGGRSEDETTYPASISKDSRLCRHVFRKNNIVNFYVSRLPPSVSEVVA